MQRISDLANGYQAAPSGYVEIFRRGTSQAATVYGDADGLETLTPPRYTLDQNGAVEAYVAEPVDLIVYDVNGDVVAGPTTEASWAGVTEYSGQSFTGTDPVTALTGAQKPVSLQTLLNRWYTSAGALDWYVQKDVAATPATWSLKSMGVVVGTAFISVKDPTYGAKGDGSTNDLTAIQNAINAAQTAGGGIVLVPPGNYNVSGALAISTAGVTVMGIGDPIIRSTVSNANVFTITAARTNIVNLGIEVAAAVGANSTGYAISIASADNCRIESVNVSRVYNTYKFARAVSVTSSSYTKVDGGYYFAVDAGIRFATATSSYNSVVNAEYVSGAVGVYIANQSFFVLSGVAYISGTIDVQGVSSTRVLVTACNLGTGGFNVDSGCSYWRESACSAPFGGFSSIVTTGGNMQFDSAPKLTDAGGTVASAAALGLAAAGAPLANVFHVTGTTNVTSITTTGLPSGYTVRLIFDGALTFTDGSNLKLAGNFVTTADDSISLVFDGTNFYETGRSVN